MTSMATISLPGNPKPLPVLAFGTGTALYKQDTKKAIHLALNSGFRAIDSAEVYANEEHTGEALTESKLGDELFVISKIATAMKDGIAEGLQKTLKELQVKSLDLYLLHLPPRGKDGLPSNFDAWKEMEKLKDQGLVKSIGVSNWLAGDIQEVYDAKPKHPIEVNEIEFHPLDYNTPQIQDTLKACKQHNITIACYSMLAPLTKGASLANNKVNGVAAEIAKAKAGRSEGTVLLKWAQQRSGGVVVTTTNKESRAKEYLEAFETGKGADDKLSEEELSRIDKAGADSEVLKVYMSPYF